MCDSGYVYDDSGGALTGVCVSSAADLDAALPPDATPATPDADIPDAPPGTPDAPPAVACRMAYMLGGALWISDVDGSNAYSIAAGNPIDSATWSPKGDLIAFGSSRELSNTTSDIYVVTPDGSMVQNLTHALDVLGPVLADTWPRWSPDGTKLLWRRGKELWFGTTDGTVARAVTALEIDDAGYVWAPDSRGIIFVHRNIKDGTISLPSDLYWISILGGPAQNITRTEEVAERTPAFAHGIYRVAYVRENDIWTTDINGLNTLDLTLGADSFEDAPRWLNDDSGIVFSSDREGAYKLFRVASTGGVAVKLTNHSLSGPVVGDFSTDISGERVIFSRYLPPSGHTFQSSAGVVNVAGDGERLLVPSATDAFGGSFGPCAD
jgi:Tol biopolymer transport system component